VPRDLTISESQTVAQDIPEVAPDPTNVKGSPADDKTDRKANDLKSENKAEKSVKGEQTKTDAVDKTADTNKVAKPAVNRPAIWKTQPKT